LNLAVLHIANHMMGQSDLYGKLSYGDKDLFVSRFDAARPENVEQSGL
jgi:hypothetical protein